MKNFLLILVFTIGFIYSHQTSAQKLKLPGADLSSQVLNAVNKVDKLGLSGDQEAKLKTHNKSFVDDVFGVLNGNLSDDAKKTKFLDLKNIRQNFLMNLLGDQLTGNYNKGVSGLLKPLKKQLGLAALAF
ncbi:hypothetical protein [Aquiflexum lacus]|uniref:hypothetical protein n=1 Tax=Aquiflexum lacus TaxID=2483805 RepID=UPI0018956EF9|nr:hypothetical protein [Aquiflexum lacus]